MADPGGYRWQRRTFRQPCLVPRGHQRRVIRPLAQRDERLIPCSSGTLGGANNFKGNGPRVGPLVISEVMYEPTWLTAAEIAAGFTSPDNFQFVEIYNPTAAAVDLSHWQLAQGITYDFADVPRCRLTSPWRSSLSIRPMWPSALTFLLRYGMGPVVLARRPLQRHARSRRRRSSVGVRRSDGSRHAGLLARPAGRRGHL